MLMEILHAVCMTRSDMLMATNSLACMLTKWDGTCGMRLRGLVSRSLSTLDASLVRYAAKGGKSCGLCVHTDADLGGCPDSQRSTSGVCLSIRGNKYMLLLVAISKRQTCACECVSDSTPEAELVAGGGLGALAVRALLHHVLQTARGHGESEREGSDERERETEWTGHDLEFCPVL